ncbi:hypothetical protein HK100_009713 [Physocladia obscura]|uniref:Uncharacterized protein n=1 Tax=Physocladia obscura TaxID=109957 RepID=A0AAD5T942_9FUNG|nr:hypothetical protein HK100_009713 [Physocladia obscura]
MGKPRSQVSTAEKESIFDAKDNWNIFNQQPSGFLSIAIDSAAIFVIVASSFPTTRPGFPQATATGSTTSFFDSIFVKQDHIEIENANLATEDNSPGKTSESIQTKETQKEKGQAKQEFQETKQQRQNLQVEKVAIAKNDDLLIDRINLAEVRTEQLLRRVKEAEEAVIEFSQSIKAKEREDFHHRMIKEISKNDANGPELIIRQDEKIGENEACLQLQELKRMIKNGKSHTAGLLSGIMESFELNCGEGVRQLKIQKIDIPQQIRQIHKKGGFWDNLKSVVLVDFND